MSDALGGRPKKSGDDGGPGWLLTYGDLVTLLMAFFVMLFAISSVEEQKFQAFLSGLSQFDNPAAELTVTPIGEPRTDAPSPIPAAVPISPAMKEDLGKRVTDAVNDAGQPGTVSIEFERRGLAVVVTTDDVLFASGSANLTDRGRVIMAALAPELRDLGKDITIEGHTDVVPLNRGGYTNWNLSTDRAVAVLNDLVGTHGFEPSRMSATGFGEHRPRDTSGTVEGRARNRRVEIVILTDGDAEAGAVDDRIEDPVGNVIPDPFNVGG